MVVKLRSPSERYRDWRKIITTLRRTPGSWVIRLPDEPYRLVRTVRERSHPALRLVDGVVEAKVVNMYRADNGSWRGDIYLRYLPSGSMPPEGGRT